MIDFEIEFDDDDAQARLAAAEAALADGTELYRRIAAALEAETEANFAAQGRPSWVPLAQETIAARAKRQGGSTVMRILQDRGILAASVSSDFGPDYAQIGAATPYAAIHQLGGTIDMPAKSTKVRLRTDAAGKLLRQGTEGSAKGRAVFARDTQKRARESWHQVDAHTITIPARPYLPFTGDPATAVLQPEARKSILDIVERMVTDAFGPG